MNWFLNFTTRTKLLTGFGLMVLLLAVIGVTSYDDIIAIQESQKHLYEEEFANVIAIKEIRNNQNAIRAAIMELDLLNKRSELETSLLREIKDRDIENEKLMRASVERNKNNPQRLSKIEEFRTIREAYRQTRETQTIPLILAGKTEEAKKIILGIQAERNTKMRTIANELVDDSDKAAEAAIIQSEKITTDSVRILLIVGFISIALAFVAVVYLNRIIANPLRQIAGVAGQVSSGDLSVSVPSYQRTDEVGILVQAFNKMIYSLQSMAEVAQRVSTGELSVTVKPQSEKDTLGNAFALMTENLKGTASVAQRIAAGDLTVTVKPQSEKDVLGNAFRLMVENLQKITGEIREGVNVVGSSGSEILAATTQVASGVAETATSVSETTTTVEEVKQTAQVSSQKAKYVLENAQKVSQASQTGRRSVEELIEGMSKIRGHMESIAESITRLSEQGQAIGEIIATVNDLTEQSNLLAVNAAIEAAKAGEQGKGFAVVAQEVRSLAEQSKQATSQIRAILNDIQKATSGAVMATEQGSKAVEVGVKQSTTAGESIRMLSDGVAEAAQAATQIAASSQQQSAGMDQVAAAMESIRQASSQNVASTKQAELSAKMLHELGQKLQQIIERFKLPSQERA